MCWQLRAPANDIGRTSMEGDAGIDRSYERACYEIRAQTSKCAPEPPGPRPALKVPAYPTGLHLYFCWEPASPTVRVTISSAASSSIMTSLPGVSEGHGTFCMSPSLLALLEKINRSSPTRTRYEACRAWSLSSPCSVRSIAGRMEECHIIE